MGGGGGVWKNLCISPGKCIYLCFAENSDWEIYDKSPYYGSENLGKGG